MDATGAKRIAIAPVVDAGCGTVFWSEHQHQSALPRRF